MNTKMTTIFGYNKSFGEYTSSRWVTSQVSNSNLQITNIKPLKDNADVLNASRHYLLLLVLALVI